MSDPRYTNRGFGLKQVVGGTVVRDYASPLVDRMREEGFRLAVGDLTFHLAQEFGFCYGVDRAIEYAYETREKFPGRDLYITGEIIHNPRVNAKLTSMGIRFLEGNYDALSEGDVVLLPAFGVETATMERLRGIGCIVVDTTCGSVLNVWKNVERYAKDGFTSLIHGTWSHEETRATSSRAGRFVVVRDMDEAGAPRASRSGGGRAGRDRRAPRARRLARVRRRPRPRADRCAEPDDDARVGVARLRAALATRLRRAVRGTGGRGAIPRVRHDRSATQERQDALNTMLQTSRSTSSSSSAGTTRRTRPTSSRSVSRGASPRSTSRTPPRSNPRLDPPSAAPRARGDRHARGGFEQARSRSG
jgi:4-hydroxy-3-methylbut-2-enyl diphosphate reductase